MLLLQVEAFRLSMRALENVQLAARHLLQGSTGPLLQIQLNC